jgi:UDP-N-acetylglucosamine diphosphorylase/glucosamine-1-phosphate N-acetyltransferase
MNVILFDDPQLRVNLLPFTYTRPAAAIRTGICTIAEKWQVVLCAPVSFATQPHLSQRYPKKTADDSWWINGALCPDDAIVSAIKALKPNHGLRQGPHTLAVRTSDVATIATSNLADYTESITLIDRVWKIFQHNGNQIREDFARLTAGRRSANIDDAHTRVYKPDHIFLEEGANVRAAILNAEHGPIYLGKNSEVQEGAVIRGPFALGEGAIINMGAKLRGDTSIGPYCKAGGEISNAVFFGYSNKAHDGFLGNSVLGEWCNIGADSNTSNLKNNYEPVKLWSYAAQGFVDTGLQFCGLMMGDHSKCGINTMFNTGTVVGVSANIFGSGFPRNFVPSFAWGGAGGLTTYSVAKALDTAARVLARRNLVLEPFDRALLTNIFETTRSERVWEKKP